MKRTPMKNDRTNSTDNNNVNDDMGIGLDFEQIVERSAKLAKEIRSRFLLFAHQTEYSMFTRSNWLRYISQYKNILQNDISRFEIAHKKVAEYRSSLIALQANGNIIDDDMALELRLRSTALDAYSACIDRLTSSQADYTTEFVRLTENDFGNASRTDTTADHFEDVLFSIEIYGLAWSFGAVHVLNRRTRHFMASCGPCSLVVKSSRKLNEAALLCRQLLAEARTARTARAQLEATAGVVSRAAGRIRPLVALSSPVSDPDYPTPEDSTPEDSNPEDSTPEDHDSRGDSDVVSESVCDHEPRDDGGGSGPELFAHGWPYTAHGHGRAADSGARRQPDSDYRWSSGLTHRAVCDLFATEALAPTFSDFPALPVPALIRVLPEEGMGRGARLRTRAAPAHLLQWGFERDAARGVATVRVSDAVAEEERVEEAVHVLKGPMSEWGQRRQQWRDLRSELQQEQVRLREEEEEGWGAGSEPAGDEMGCPADIWDEPPNGYWHPLAAAAAAGEWARFQAAALRGAAGGGSESAGAEP